MKRIYVLLVVGLFGVCSLSAQKKPLHHTDFDLWKRMGNVTYSPDGKYGLYAVSAQASDGYVALTNLLTGASFTINRGKSPAMTFDGKYAVCGIAPLYQDTYQARVAKKKADDMPKDSLCIWVPGQTKLTKYPSISSFKMAGEGNLAVAFKTKGSDLMLHYFATGKVDTIKSVGDYSFVKDGTRLFFVRKLNIKDSSQTKDGLYLYDLVAKREQALLTGPRKSRFFLPASDKEEKYFAFYANPDTSKAAEKSINVYFYKRGDAEATLLVDSKVKGLPKDWIVSQNGTLSINKEGTRLFFGIAPKPLEKDTTLIDFETAKLDIWHYLDDYVQTVQLFQLPTRLKASYLSYIQIQNPQLGLVQLATPDIAGVQVPNDWSSAWAYSTSNQPYRIETQWNSDSPEDLYIVNVADGKAKKVITAGVLTNISPSPEGNYLVWFDKMKRAWFSYEVATEKMRNLTDGIGVAFWNEKEDRPQLPGPYGNGGWREGDAAFLVNDRYDIWEVDPSGAKAPAMLTEGVGRKEQYTLRIVRLDGASDDGERDFIATKPSSIKPKEMLYFTVFDNVNKTKGFYCKDQSKKGPQMQKMVVDGYSFSQLKRSKDGKAFTYIRSNYSESPNLYITRDLFKTQTQLSDINPQQKEFNWGTAELVRWTSANGIPCDGILYKPEDFDPGKKYPMILYFYETRSEGLYNYIPPSLSGSTINTSYAVSNGYLFFCPDIHYTIGHPGQSAMNCIMPGVEMLCKNPWVDDQNMAIQGQSWGGYQVAYMVTQTNRFKCALAGAAVSNMTSAYGGIRWGSGKVRQFQYEYTQSRIGQNLWDGLDLYIENSPIFHAPKVTTPLLIFHNDNDGAVPWYQGIEYFTALRRLGKQAWMLQYNNEGHGLGQRANRIDLTIRLKQFYDHFLKGAPAPVWIKEGVPATKKGIDWGLGFE